MKRKKQKQKRKQHETKRTLQYAKHYAKIRMINTKVKHA